MLIVDTSITVPETELTVHFLRADGPGGQHVNRTESAVELRFDVRQSPSLPEAVRERVLARRDRRLTAEGVLVIQGRRFRDQARNRDDVRARLLTILRAATTPPVPRIPTRPTRASRQRRLTGKLMRGQLKRSRGRQRSDHE